MESKVAVITGGARGIGRAAAEKFLAEGWKIALLDTLTEVMNQWAGSNPNVLCIECDITSTDNVKAAADRVIAHYGHVNALINNAGIIPKGRNYIKDHDDEVLLRIINTNIVGTYRVTKTFGNLMIKTGKGGSIVSISSISGWNPMSGSMAYAITKSAIISMAKTVAIEWGQYGIRSNVVCPGQIISDMTRERFLNDPVAKAARLGSTPLERYGEVEDIADAIYFFASNESSYISGETLLVDGGLTANMYHVQGKQ